MYQQPNQPPPAGPPQWQATPPPPQYQSPASPPGQPYPQPGHQYPPPGFGQQAPPPKKRRGGLVALVVVLSLLVVAGGAGAWWFFSGPGGDGPGAPQADGLTVEDAESGITYHLPDTWEEMPAEDLIDAYTSSASHTTDAGGASVFAFSGEAMTGEEMSFTTSTIAGENSEYFYPYAEDRQILVSEPTEVDGLEAYRFTWEVDKADDEPMYGHIVHILTDDGRSVFLMGIAYPDDPALRTEVDAAVSSVTIR